jgi:hypothetical protein
MVINSNGDPESGALKRCGEVHMQSID